MPVGDVLRIFVAMPVKTMGQDASWSDVSEIRARLLAPAAAKIGERLGRRTQIFIEDEKKISGQIPASMFAEAIDAEIYIADLTGSSANVFLELGVRWAVKDGVTILISQDTGNLKFNVAYNRAIEYGPMPTKLDQAIADIADFAVTGMSAGIVDSPVRSGGRLVTYPKAEIEALRAEIGELRSQRGDDLLAVAESMQDIKERIDVLRQAVTVNPVGFDARLLLGRALREVADYDGAERQFESATELEPKSAVAWQELGTTQSKKGSLSSAADSFAVSLELDQNQAETWRVLGGLRRRLARDEYGNIVAWQQMRASREAYEHSITLDPDQSYGLFNFLLLSLILALKDGLQTTSILAEFEILRRLCDYQVARNPRDPWKRLDLAATLAVLERESDANTETSSALNVAGQTRQLSYIDSAVPPLRDLLSVLEAGSIRFRSISHMINQLELAHKAATAR